jgi:RimJ/RimL family protein N-acetyltransferase
MFPDLTRDEVFMIGTRHLWLRWPRLDDAEALARIGGHSEVASMTASWPVDCDAAYARERIEKMRTGNKAGTALTLVIAERSQWSRAIGLVGIDVTADTEDGRPTGTLGYHLDPAYWSRGYTREAISGLLDMTRLLTRIGVVKASVMPHNGASMRVLTACGFAPVGAGHHDSPLRGRSPVETYEVDVRASSFGKPMSRSSTRALAAAV